MKPLYFVATVAWSLIVGGVCSNAEAARGCRPATRRCCVGVTHQPCSAASIRAPRCENAVTTTTECTCAFFPFVYHGGYYTYYAIDYYPDCNTSQPVGMDGNFTIGTNDPCPTCPTNQCIQVIRTTSHTPGSHQFKPGTRLDKALQWDQKLALKSGTAKTKGPNGTERAIEIETKELADAKMLVSFTTGNTLYFAKLHVVRVEAQNLGKNKSATVSDFAIGQEIEAPPADQKVRDVTSQIKILDTNVAQIRIGNTTYQVVTATPLAE